MDYPAILHHGAFDGVTGSCHQLFLEAQVSFLIDCGLFQGAEAGVAGVGENEQQEIAFSIAGIKSLVLTHVHIDHVGRLPALLAAGFAGPIICSEPSARLLPLVLEDALRLSGYDKLQVEALLKAITLRVIALPYEQWFGLVDAAGLKCQVRLQRAGHILGSTYIEFDIDYLSTGLNRRIVFSGDLGSANTPMLPRPRSPERADVLVLESTYGDRLHEDRTQRQARLESVIERALADQGTVLIPAFSIGRTQELLYEIEDILHKRAGREVNSRRQETQGDPDGFTINWPELPVILDSPLATRFTRVYEELNDFWVGDAQGRLEDGRRPLSFPQLITIDSHLQHMKVVNYLASTGRPAIVIAGGGMCTGGRIVNYLKAMLGDSRHNVVFVGYQARGTPGAAIQKYAQSGGYVELDRERYLIKAGVATIGGYSAHADQAELVEFVAGIGRWPEEIRLVHGDVGAKRALELALDLRAPRRTKVV